MGEKRRNVHHQVIDFERLSVAIVTALIVAIGPQIGWETQFVLFGVLSLISAYFGRRYVKWRPVKSQDDTLNRRGEQFVGRVFEVVQAIENGEGRVGDGS